MGYINEKLNSLNYYQLSILLTSLKRDKEGFLICEIKPPEKLIRLISRVIEEIEKRADLIPSEMLMNDLNFNYILIDND